MYGFPLSSSAQRPPPPTSGGPPRTRPPQEHRPALAHPGTRGAAHPQAGRCQRSPFQTDHLIGMQPWHPLWPLGHVGDTADPLLASTEHPVPCLCANRGLYQDDSLNRVAGHPSQAGRWAGLLWSTLKGARPFLTSLVSAWGAEARRLALFPRLQGQARYIPSGRCGSHFLLSRKMPQGDRSNQRAHRMGSWGRDPRGQPGHCRASGGGRRSHLRGQEHGVQGQGAGGGPKGLSEVRAAGPGKHSRPAGPPAPRTQPGLWTRTWACSPAGLQYARALPAARTPAQHTHTGPWMWPFPSPARPVTFYSEGNGPPASQGLGGHPGLAACTSRRSPCPPAQPAPSMHRWPGQGQLPRELTSAHPPRPLQVRPPLQFDGSFFFFLKLESSISLPSIPGSLSSSLLRIHQLTPVSAPQGD